MSKERKEGGACTVVDEAREVTLRPRQVVADDVASNDAQSTPQSMQESSRPMDCWLLNQKIRSCVQSAQQATFIH
jgi:hypothetical protein